MRYQFTFSLFIIYAAYSTIIAQKHDYVWLMGENSLTVPEYAGTVIDFNIQPPDIYYEFRDMFFFQTNASICDTAGNLLFYTNGIYIANSLGEPMENGEGLNPGALAETWQDYGYILDQGAIILPVPEHDSLYYLLHMDRALNQQQTGSESPHFYYSLINMNSNGGLGTVELKNQLVMAGPFDIGKITSVKHANGRDWWVILRLYGTNRFFSFSFSNDKISIYPYQELGVPIPEPPGSLGQAVFSPDGSKYVRVNLTGIAGDPIYVSIFDFDRCTGELALQTQFTYADTAWCAGLAISPNNRFLYVSSFKYLYQYDLWAANIESSRITVATWDGFEESGFFATTFYLAQLAPDGKIYINSNNGVSYLHVINNPDSLGLACDVCQHCIDLPTINAVSLPNFPNYRLHHLAGSPCDTLRSPPLALWGYELQGAALHCTDSSRHDIRTWHWDFGDGHTDTLQHPVHTYTAGGVYNVCLAVSNPRGADTLCQVVQVVVDGVEEESGKRIAVNVSPNPVSRHGQIALDVHLPGAGAAAFVLRDMPGREALRFPLRLTDGRTRQSVSLGSLPAGVYIAALETEKKTVWTEKVLVY